MANEERNENDFYIKPIHRRKTRTFFVTSSAKMDDNAVTKTTISSSVFTEMSKSFYDGEHLLDEGVRDLNGGVIYMLQQMQEDIDDVYNEVSASVFQASFFPFARINSGSFGLISSSLVPDKDGVHHLGANGKEWNDLYIDGTANIDSLAMGTTVTSIKDEDNMSSDSNTALATQQSIKKYVDDNGGGTVDSSLSNSSTNAVRNSAVHAGLALKLNLTGGALTGALTTNSTIDGVDIATRDGVLTSTKTTADAALPKTGGVMTGVIGPVYSAITSITNNNIDVRAIDVIQISSKSAWTLNTAVPAYAGQQLTIIAISAGTITHSTNIRGFTMARGRNLSARPNSVYQFVSNGKYWYQVVI